MFASIDHPDKVQCSVKEWSNKTWQFESGLSICNTLINRWKKKHPAIIKFEQELSEAYIQSHIQAASANHLQHVYQCLATVSKFYFKRRHCRLQFWLYNRRQKALNKLCKDIGKEADIIAIGDPVFSSVSRGYAPTPTLTIVKELQHLYPNKVHLIDEYKTSKLCSTCHLQQLEFTKMKIPGSGRTNMRIQRCKNCKTYWNRDVNAARNMRALFVHQRDNNGARIPEFDRPN